MGCITQLAKAMLKSAVGYSEQSSSKKQLEKYRNNPLRIFISHCSKDKAVVRELYQRLEGQIGLEPWLDEEKISIGEDWDREIRRTLRRAQVAIICLSPNAIKARGYFQKEVKLILDAAARRPKNKIFIVPVKVKKCEPPKRFQRWQMVDLSAENAYGRLLDTLLNCMYALHARD